MRSLFSMPHWLMAIGVSLALFAPSGLAAEEKPGLKIFTADTEFEDAAFELENAIVDRGLKIDYRGHIGKMMERTADDFGGDKANYKDAQFLTFCSVALTRAMIKADPQNVGFCPYVVFLYELKTEPGKTYIGYRRPVAAGSAGSIEAVKAIDKLLFDIIRQATE